MEFYFIVKENEHGDLYFFNGWRKSGEIFVPVISNCQSCFLNKESVELDLMELKTHNPESNFIVYPIEKFPETFYQLNC